MADIPDNYLDFVQQKKAFASWLRDGGGSPQVTPVWFDYTDGRDSREHRQRPGQVSHLAAGAPVAIAIMDPDNPYRYIQIRGRVTRAIEEGADAHIDSLAKNTLARTLTHFASLARCG